MELCILWFSARISRRGKAPIAGLAGSENIHKQYSSHFRLMSVQLYHKMIEMTMQEVKTSISMLETSREW